MKITIVRRYDFEAAHFLPHVPDGHKCKTMHGHSYVMEFHVTGEVQTSGPAAGMVVDFDVIDAMGRMLVREFDHRPLNQVMENPTVENMAPYIWRRFSEALAPELSVRIVFREGPRSACIYPPYPFET
jgi:6-pyruvoyltetrahydropterin/6-carboxytetrahydropterin synthase